MPSDLATIDDRVIEYVRRGSGPACILAPVSWGIDYSLWAHYLADLEGKLTMVYFNPRGIGRSSAITSPSDCSMDSIVSDIERMRKHLELDKIILMGHSAGGFSALKYATRRLENLKGLVLIGTAANTDYERDFDELTRTDERVAGVLDEMREPVADDMSKEDIMRRNLRLMFSVYFQDWDAYRDEFLEILSDSRLSPTHLMYHQQVDLPKYNVLDDLGQIDCPSLVVAGRHDPISPPKVSEVLERGLPKSTLVVFEKSGHWPFIEEKDRFATTMADFLEGL